MLRFIRSALHMLFLTVTVIPWSLTVVALSPFVSKQWLYGFCHVWVRMVVASARPLLGIRTRVRGLENLPAGPQAAAVLLRTSPEYRRLLGDLSATPDNSPMPADLQAAATVSAALGHDGADGNAAASAASAPAAE